MNVLEEKLNTLARSWDRQAANLLTLGERYAKERAMDEAISCQDLAEAYEDCSKQLRHVAGLNPKPNKP